MMEENRFHWADYLVFAATLAVSTGVGIYFGCTGKKQSTTDEFLMAGRNMAVLPVSVSLFVSWLSAISFLGDPVEVYVHGAIYWFLGVGYVLALPFVAQIFAPTFQKMNLVSAYEFLGEKYHTAIRLLCSISTIATTFGWLGIVLYAPAIALSQVSGMPVWVAITSIGLVCTFYTTVGGMKAVLWADTLQCLIMVAGQLAVVIQGAARVGGMARVWEIADKGGRLNFWTLDPNPLVRISLWSFLIGGFFRVFTPYVYTQMCIQRYCTLSTPRKAKLAVYLNVPMFAVAVSLFALIGLVMYAMYHDCDPLLAGRIERRDQMVPLMVLELLGEFPGVPGLFMACVFSASLSSLSSGFNAMAANALSDIVMPLYTRVTGRELSDSKGTIIAKILAATFGLLNLAISFVVLEFGSSIFEMCIKVVGIIGSPMSGVMVCAVVFPSVDLLSICVGFTLSFALCLWWGIGGFFVPRRGHILPVDASCLLPGAFNATTVAFSPIAPVTEAPYTAWLESSTPEAPLQTQGFSVSELYYWNPLLYGALGSLTTVGVALVLHYTQVLFGKCCNKDKYSVAQTEEIRQNYPGDAELPELFMRKKYSNGSQLGPGDVTYNDLKKLNETTF